MMNQLSEGVSVKQGQRAGLAVAVLATLLLVACSGGSRTGAAGNKSADQKFDLNAPTVGPNGESSTLADSVPALSADQVATIKAQHYRVALLMAGSGTWYSTADRGIQAEAAALGMTIVSNAEANFDPATQTNQVETAMAAKPDLVLTLPVDPVAARQAFTPALTAGAKIVFLDNGVNGWSAGNQYVAIITGDHYQQGEDVADLMSKALGPKGGKIGVIYYDASFYVTNNRDKAFRAAIAQRYPKIKVVASSGFTTEQQTAEVASSMLTRYPDLDGIYVGWNAAATGVLAALRDAGNHHTKVVTYDLDTTNDLQIAQGGNLYGTVADRPYQEGQMMVRLGAMSLLGLKTPPFVVVKPVLETKSTIVQAWQESAATTPPKPILNALGGGS
jgi:ribose transport system substrate-binding protein